MKPMSTFTQPDQQANRLEQLLNTLGCAYLRRQQYSEAFEKFQQLLELGTDDPSVYKNAATASIGLGFISEQALDLYQEALDRNPEAAELKINLATLFLKNNVDSDFATNVYKAAVDLQPPNAKELRRFLENQSKNGNSANLTRAELEKAVPGVHDSPLRGNELETLWWAGNFDEARAVIEKSSATGPDKSQRLLQLALTHAYQLIYNDEETKNIDVIRLLWHGLGSINPADSLEALRNYLTIRLPLLNSHTEQAAMTEKLDEYDFILGRIPLDDYFNQFDKERDTGYLNLNEFDLERELINALEKPPGREHRSENLEVEWNGLLFLEIMDRDNPEVLDRLLELFGNHLAAMPNCLLRRVGKGFLCLANNATLLM
ncbi:MAG: tetratricopeptide repeat protein, partial [bacterium]